MPVTIEEMTADVTPSENRGTPSDSAAPQPDSPSQQRRQKDQLERIHQRALRVRAN